MQITTNPKDPFELMPRRVHEAQGSGRQGFAIFQAARYRGPLIWIIPVHPSYNLMPRGLPDGVGQRIHLIRPTNEVDLLWATEEALRSSAPELVISEPKKPLSLTAGRRLQLAAEAGKTTGLMLIREGQGNNATETRWQCAPVAGDAWDSTAHHWELRKNKKGTLGFWTVNWNGETTAFHMVSADGERHRVAETAR